MISQNNLKEIKKTVDEFFEKTGLDIEAEIMAPEGRVVFIKTRTDEPKVLIGQNGKTLAEIQRLLRAVLRKRIPEEFYINLDINNYKIKKAEYLKETARDLADEVALNKEEKKMDPMSAYERRIVHVELSERQDIITRSVGQEPERYIVIWPAGSERNLS